jgi:hypothetical protein
MEIPGVTAILIGVQIATIGWRVNREIPLSDAGRRTWFPVADWANIVSLIWVIVASILLPLNDINAPDCSRTALSVGFILIGMYPINVIGHYRFVSPKGRSIYKDDYPYISDHEWFTLSLTGMFVAAYFLLCHVGLFH